MVSCKYLATTLLAASSALAAPHGHKHTHSMRQTATASHPKRGAAYNDPTLVQALSDSGAVSWAYDWNMETMGTLPSGVEFVPMLWGSKMFTGWWAAIQTILNSGSTHIMGFNEPDMASQASMSSSDAAGYYKEYITKFKKRATLLGVSLNID